MVCLSRRPLPHLSAALLSWRVRSLRAKWLACSANRAYNAGAAWAEAVQLSSAGGTQARTIADSVEQLGSTSAEQQSQQEGGRKRRKQKSGQQQLAAEEAASPVSSAPSGAASTPRHRRRRTASSANGTAEQPEAVKPTTSQSSSSARSLSGDLAPPDDAAQQAAQSRSSRGGRKDSVAAPPGNVPMADLAPTINSSPGPAPLDRRRGVEGLSDMHRGLPSAALAGLPQLGRRQPQPRPPASRPAAAPVGMRQQLLPLPTRQQHPTTGVAAGGGSPAAELGDDSTALAPGEEGTDTEGPAPRKSRAQGRRPRRGWRGGQHLLQQRPVGKQLLEMRRAGDTGEEGTAGGPLSVGAAAGTQQEAVGAQQTHQLQQQSSEAGAQPSATAPPPAGPLPTSLATPGALKLLKELGLPEPSVRLLVTVATMQRPDQRALLEEQGVRQACHFLADELGLPIGNVPGLLMGAPELLVTPPEELNNRAQLLNTLWRGRRFPLKQALLARPELLTRGFFVLLGPALQALVSLGFSQELACRAVVNCPDIVQRRRYELAAAIRRAHIDLEAAPPKTFAFLAKHSQLMLPDGDEEVSSLVALLATFGLQPASAMEVIVGQPWLLKHSRRHMMSVVNMLRSSGFKAGEVTAVLRGFPPVLAVSLQRVRVVLQLVRASGVPMSEVVEYPRVFIHDPANYTAPRLAYLKARLPGRAEQLALVTVLSRTDAEFAETNCKVPLEEYLVFKDRWLSLYGKRFGLAPERAVPLQKELRQRLAQEVAGQLFSPIDWEAV